MLAAAINIIYVYYIDRIVYKFTVLYTCSIPILYESCYTTAECIELILFSRMQRHRRRRRID